MGFGSTNLLVSTSNDSLDVNGASNKYTAPAKLLLNLNLISVDVISQPLAHFT